MTIIATRLQAVRNRIAAAAQAAGRPAADIRLIAVSKTFPPADIAQALAVGQTTFGESYLQEAIPKIEALRRYEASGEVASPEGLPLRPLEWHYIGPIQSNKTKQIAELFDWVHGVDRLKVAERLSTARPEGVLPLDICIQVNVSGELSKSGVPPQDALSLARAVHGLPGIRLRGLMGIPEPDANASLMRARFRQIRELREEIVAAGIAMDTLSMGMSDDLEAAIAEGATMVRVGRAIFGDRPAQPR
jgi:pyridoxal phosphate enzyme (YggS family)